MGIDVIIAMFLAAAILATFLAGIALVSWLSTKCPQCGRRRLRQIDAHVLYDPAPEWRLYKCRECGAEFIRVRRRYTLRRDWRGDPEAQRMFEELTQHQRAVGKV